MMKILESQSALLTNYEVFQHLQEQKKNHKNQRRRVPTNLDTIRKDVLVFLGSEPLPQSQKPPAYKPDSIARLLKALRPYNLSKGEIIMMLNLRPASVAALNTVIDDMESRFPEEKQGEMLEVVAEVLGQLPTNGVEEEGEEESAAAAAAAAGANGQAAAMSTEE